MVASARILFYGGKWYFLSNFAAFKVLWHGIWWMTSEHAYQAAKFWGNELLVEKIKNAPSAHEAFKIARAHDCEKLPYWDGIKVSVMKQIVLAKHDQHPYIQRKLQETGEAEIIEDSPTDSFWGRGPDWKGENHLGKIWMEIREERRRPNER